MVAVRERDLAIYFTNGCILYFKDVSRFYCNGEEITFYYSDKTLQKEMFAEFKVNSIAGYSISLAQD